MSEPTIKKRNILLVIAFAILLFAIIAAALYIQSMVESYDLMGVLPDSTELEMVGETAPDFNFLGEQGHELLLSDFKGTPIVLNFWASWCPPCRMEKPHFQQAYEQYGSDVKFIILNINEPIETARAYADEEGFTFPLYFDEMRAGAAAFNVTGVPETFFIDADGKVSARFLGAIDFRTIEHSIQEMLE